MLYPTKRETQWRSAGSHRPPRPADTAYGPCWAVAGIAVGLVAAVAIAINIGNATLPDVVPEPLNPSVANVDRTCHNDGVGTTCFPRPDDPTITYQH